MNKRFDIEITDNYRKFVESLSKRIESRIIKMFRIRLRFSTLNHIE
jgi:hypothetical protein